MEEVERGDGGTEEDEYYAKMLKQQDYPCFCHCVIIYLSHGRSRNVNVFQYILMIHQWMGNVFQWDEGSIATPTLCLNCKIPPLFAIVELYIHPMEELEIKMPHAYI